jgi:WD40 repeat protein
MGHREAVFCATFDKTGDRIITGADDKQIKIWCTRTGRLLATLRGHEKEISNMDVNASNTLLATSSLDGVIRVWCLKSGSQVAVLAGHRAGSEIGTINVSFACRP